jgi:transcription elongation GreA/GreB family factor
MVFEIVGQNEADPSLRKISNLSPLGEKMLGKRVNDKFDFVAPNGETVSYTILEIE